MMNKHKNLAVVGIGLRLNRVEVGIYSHTIDLIPATLIIAGDERG